MIKYEIIFGTDFNNKSTLDSQINLVLFDSKDDKTLSDAKDFITCVNDTLCTCMLKLYTISKGTFYNSYIRYNKDDDDSLPLKKIADNSNIYIGQIKKKCVCPFFEDNKKLFSLQKKSLIEKINQLEKKSELREINEKDFYDIIIDVNSIISLNNGWKIEFTENGLKKYNEFKNELLLKIGIVGNVNNGKSFILSKLSQIDLPSGVSIRTKGLSIKYPYLQDGHEHRKFILLDTAGFENPILIDENEEEVPLDNKNYEEINKFRIKARDILITEYFLQNFVISTSDLLLVVIDKLSFSEQKLINKIKSGVKINNAKKKKSNYYYYS